MKLIPSIFCLVVGWLYPSGSATGQSVPAGYSVPTDTLSPDHRFGVTVPKHEYPQELDNPENNVINIQTGIVIGTILQEFPAFDRTSHGELYPCWWKANDSQMLWQVEGKWGKRAVVLITLKDKKTIVQIDLLKKMQDAILVSTMRSIPGPFQEAEKENQRNGQAYPDGFTVDAVLNSNGGPMSFPLRFQVFLTADPKANVDHVQFQSRMQVTFSRSGDLTVEAFHIGDAPPAPNWGRQ